MMVEEMDRWLPMKRQCEVIESAWNDAQVDRANLGYMEAHGTGTDVGDVAEFNGLLRAFPNLKGDAIIVPRQCCHYDARLV